MTTPTDTPLHYTTLRPTQRSTSRDVYDACPDMLRRARIVAVTDEGARVVAEARAVVDRVYDDVLGTLPARERAAFVSACSGARPPFRTMSSA